MSNYIKISFYAAGAGALLWIGSWLGQQKHAPARVSGGRTVLYYVDPMNPAHSTPGPGLAPCGMKMEPVYAEVAPMAPGPGSPERPAGTVKITPEQQQRIGVRLGAVEAKPARHSLRLLGKVAVQENRLYRVVANVTGMITKTCPYAPGTRVYKEDPLASMYSPEFTGAIQSLLSSLGAQDRDQALNKAGAASASSITYYGNSVQNNIDNLKYLGVGERQVEEIVRTRKLQRNPDIASPADGVVLNWNIAPGLRFEKGTELLRIADLSKVWIVADVYENEAGYLHPGMPVRVTLFPQQKTVAATCSDLVPQFDGVSRTLKVRLEVENPDLGLQPDMFVEAELSVSLPERLAIPSEAVLDSGMRQTVYVHQGDGFFEPRVVTLGRRLGEQVEVLEGLESGEQIVLAGNFLLDSESRMKLSAGGGGMKSAIARTEASHAKDPVCGMAIEAAADSAAQPHSAYRGKMYYFCAEVCKQKFDKDPGVFVVPSVEAARPAMSSN